MFQLLGGSLIIAEIVFHFLFARQDPDDIPAKTRILQRVDGFPKRLNIVENIDNFPAAAPPPRRAWM